MSWISQQQETLQANAEKEVLEEELAASGTCLRVGSVLVVVMVLVVSVRVSLSLGIRSSPLFSSFLLVPSSFLPRPLHGHRCVSLLLSPFSLPNDEQRPSRGTMQLV